MVWQGDFGPFTGDPSEWQPHPYSVGTHNLVHATAAGYDSSAGELGVHRFNDERAEAVYAAHPP
jgi:hypothetical protein